MNGTTDRVVLTVVYKSGLHEKTAFRTDRRVDAAFASLRMSKRDDVVRTSVDLVREYKGSRIVRVWVGREGVR